MPRCVATRRTFLRSGAGIAAGSLAATAPWSFAEEQGAPDIRLKITAVRTFQLQHKLQRPFGVSISVPLDPIRTTLLVKIETDQGLVGWGETAPIGGVRGAIEDSLGPLLIGRNPLDYRRLTLDLWGRAFFEPLAIGALDTAINDIRGQALNVPIAELFGHRLRDRVPAYASAMNYLEGIEPEKNYPDEAARLVSEGYRAMKMRLGRFSVRREAKIAEAVRDAVGPDVRLFCDANAAYTVGDALDMGAVLHELDFGFFEEPLPQEPDYAGYAELRERLPLPLAGGEVLANRKQAHRLLNARAFDIIQPDLSLCGGIPEVLFIAELAALYGVPIIPHCWGGAILIAATTHLLSLIRDPHAGFPTDTPYLELDQSENPWRTEIVKAPVEFKDGFVTVPTAPGLGLEVDEQAVKRYAV